LTIVDRRLKAEQFATLLPRLEVDEQLRDKLERQQAGEFQPMGKSYQIV
jgi:hypothetical protein